jgi:hypothetical protein
MYPCMFGVFILKKKTSQTKIGKLLQKLVDTSFYFLWTKLIWSIDLVISKKKKKIIDFLDELGLFIGEKPIFTKKKFRRSAAVCGLPSAVISWLSIWNVCPQIFERCFQLSTGLTGVSFHFWPQKQIPSGSSHTNF